MAIILASKSPRRKELLGFITEDFNIKVSDAEEITDPALSAEDTVKALALLKGEAVVKDFPDDIIISADTVVVLDGRILGKPHSREEAFSMLSALSGRSHTVYTGVCVISKDINVCFAEATDVTFAELCDEEINAYIETGEPFDKAGAYGIQGKGSIMITSINGDYYNVMGLPVSRLYKALKDNSII